LEAAAQLFHKQGFGATGVATVLRRAGVKSGSLYHFFPSKEALLGGVVQRHLELLRATVHEPAESASHDPIERVFALLELYRRNLLMTGCTQGCPIGNLALEVGDGMSHVRALIDAYFSDWAEGVRIWLEAAGERLPADFDRAGLSQLVLTVMEGAVMRARAAGRIEPFDAAVTQLRSYLELLEERARRERGEGPGLAAGVNATRPEEKTWPMDRSAWRHW
jgi:AcrR family transcriptional regulator